MFHGVGNALPHDLQMVVQLGSATHQQARPQIDQRTKAIGPIHAKNNRYKPRVFTELLLPIAHSQKQPIAGSRHKFFFAGLYRDMPRF